MITQSITQWKQYLKLQKGFSDKTIIAYVSDLNHLIHFISNSESELINDANELSTEIEKINLRIIRNWLIHRKNLNYNNSSNARAISAVKNFYKFTLKDNIKLKDNKIYNHPIFSIKTPKKSKIMPKALSEEDVIKAIKRIENMHEQNWINLRNQCILYIIYLTGARISEILSIRKKDITRLQEGHHLILEGKGGKQRSIPLLDMAQQMITQYLESLPYSISDSDPIFLGLKGKPLNPKVFNRDLITLRRINGMPECLSAHAFRHSFATHLLQNGANLKSIQELLGHNSLETTQRYTKITSKHLETVYAKSHPLSHTQE